MEANLIEKKLTYIQCPECGDHDSHCISDVERDTSFGAWYCARCGTGIMGSISSRGVVDICEVPERRDPTFVLLRLDSQDAPVFLIVQGSDTVDLATGKTRAESDEDDAFLYSDEVFYNYDCPPSIALQKVIAVIKNGDPVSQGLLQYVATRPAPRGSTGSEREEQAFQELLVPEPAPAPDMSVPASQQISR